MLYCIFTVEYCSDFTVNLLSKVYCVTLVSTTSLIIFAEFDASNTFQTHQEGNNERLRKLWNTQKKKKKHLFGTFCSSTGLVVTGKVTAEARLTS